MSASFCSLLLSQHDPRRCAKKKLNEKNVPYPLDNFALCVRATNESALPERGSEPRWEDGNFFSAASLLGDMLLSRNGKQTRDCLVVEWRNVVTIASLSDSTQTRQPLSKKPLVAAQMRQFPHRSARNVRKGRRESLTERGHPSRAIKLFDAQKKGKKRKNALHSSVTGPVEGVALVAEAGGRVERWRRERSETHFGAI